MHFPSPSITPAGSSFQSFLTHLDLLQVIKLWPQSIKTQGSFPGSEQLMCVRHTPEEAEVEYHTVLPAITDMLITLHNTCCCS